MANQGVSKAEPKDGRAVWILEDQTLHSPVAEARVLCGVENRAL